MKKIKYILLLVAFTAAFNLKAQNPVVAPAQAKPIMLTGGTVHTGTGEVIENGIIAFSSGKITFVGKPEDCKLDRASYSVTDISGKQVYPGLILPCTALGLVEIGGVDVTVDTREIGDLNPNVRAIPAYNTDSHVIPVVRSNGVLLAQIMPQGSLMPGLSSVVQLDAWNWEDAAYRMDNGMLLGWPRKAAFGGRYAAFYAQMAGSASSAYDRNVEQLEKIFTDATAYAALEKPSVVNLRLEAMKGLFDGSKILFISSSEAKGIEASINFAKRFGVKRIVLYGAGETAWQVKDFLKENNIPIILSSPLSLPANDESDLKLPYKLPAMFMHEGILVALTYAQQAYPNLPFAAGITVDYGMTREDALKTVTSNTAKILGIDDKTGSLEVGKDANIVVSSGDILDITTNNVTDAFITGRKIDLDNKFRQLYRRFSAKYQQGTGGR
jgi:imidazolonepropionase-like amidohydrolase